MKTQQWHCRDTGRLKSTENSTLAMSYQGHTGLKRSWEFSFINILIGGISDSLNLVRKWKRSGKIYEQFNFPDVSSQYPWYQKNIFSSLKYWDSGLVVQPRNPSNLGDWGGTTSRVVWVTERIKASLGNWVRSQPRRNKVCELRPSLRGIALDSHAGP